jgi:hypothetical protein
VTLRKIEFEQNPLDPDEDFWRGRITGKTGRSDNIEWLHNGTEHSFTGLTRTILKKITGEKRVVNGYRYWIHIEHDLTLTELRQKKAGDLR